MVMSARRRQAEDLQALLDGGRASSRPGRPGPGPAGRAGPRARAAPTSAAAEFRASLRERLLTEAAARVPARRRTVDRERPSAGPRLRQAVAAVAVASVVAGVGAAAASTRACPATRSTASSARSRTSSWPSPSGDVGKGRELLEQADARLAEAEAPGGEESTRLTPRRGPGSRMLSTTWTPRSPPVPTS